MSYILDALKKADSERERGLVPSVHAHPLAAARPLPSAPGSKLVLMLVLAVFAITTIGMLLWRWLEPVPTAALVSPPPALVTPVQPPAAPTPSAALPGAPNPAASMTSAATPAASAAAPAQAPPRAVMAPAQVTAEASPPSGRAAVGPGRERSDRVRDKDREGNNVPSPARAAPAQAPARTHTTPPPEMASTGQRITPIGELPPDIRQSLPKLVVSGATYSDNPAWRMLIINGQVFREGDKPAADLQLEQIRPKSAVLNYKGQRYLMAY